MVMKRERESSGEREQTDACNAPLGVSRTKCGVEEEEGTRGQCGVHECDFKMDGSTMAVGWIQWIRVTTTGDPLYTPCTSVPLKARALSRGTGGRRGAHRAQRGAGGDDED
jgi:hypothetical protein